MGYKRNKEALRVGAIVYRAIKSGKLIRPDRCGRCRRKCKPDAHHEDYNKPFEITWLCRRCHKKRHARDSPPTWLWKAKLHQNDTIGS